jgi:uncharacterized YccA/Bax inhibitor family protein
MRTTNPSIRNLQNYCHGEDMVVGSEKTASYLGVALKGFFMLGATFVSAVITAYLTFTAGSVLAGGLLAVASILALVFAILASFFPNTVKVTGTLYAVCEGALVGFVSALANAVGYGGAVTAALFSTLITFGVMLALYATGVVKVGNGLRNFLFVASISVLLTQLVGLILGLIFPGLWALFYGNGFLPIVCSLVMILLATGFLLVDLDNVARVVDTGMHKKYEWNAAYGLVVTLIWLYMEFLRFFILIFGRKRR